MKTKNIVAACLSCATLLSTGCVKDPIHEPEGGGPNVYATGMFTGSSNANSTVWKNGETLYERTDAGLFSLLISEGNIFTGGYKSGNDNIIIPLICKNGTLLYTLTDGTKNAGIANMAISEGQIYACGNEENENGIKVAKIWKDGAPLYSLTDGTSDSYAKDIACSGGHIYTCGLEIEKESLKWVGKIWKDGNLLYTLTDENNEVDIYLQSLKIVDGALYTAGTAYDPNPDKYRTKVWKNDEVIYTSDESLSTELGSAHCMVVSDGDIYLVVAEKMDEQSSGGYMTKVLKNGKELYRLTDGSHFAGAYSITISDGDVYTCGHEATKEGLPTGKIWKNDTLLYTTEDVFYTDIAVE